MDAALIFEALHLLAGFDRSELVAFFWLVILIDVPRYFLAAVVTAIIPIRHRPAPPRTLSTAALIAAHNEPDIGRCIASIIGQVDQVVVVDDGSSDETATLAALAGATVIRVPERSGKPAVLNVALDELCGTEVILVCDADSLVMPGAIDLVLPYFDDPRVGGVSLNLGVANVGATLTTRYQAIEYAVSVTAGRRISDALGILPNVSGAAGAFRRAAVTQVGGYDFEVAEDAALAMKLRDHGWKLRFAPEATVLTHVPETIPDLMLQRIRWDAGIVTIWWRKFAHLLNPFSQRFRPLNLLTSVEVLLFSAILPTVLLFYVAWLLTYSSHATLVLLTAAAIGLSGLTMVLVLLAGVELPLLLYVPFYVIVQMLVLRPLTILTILAELSFTISRFDSYLPRRLR